jgi:DnaJ-class molecular chaperone
MKLTCPTCKGKGSVPSKSFDYHGDVSCPTCFGWGAVDAPPDLRVLLCPKCGAKIDIEGKTTPQYPSDMRRVYNKNVRA